MAIEGLRTAPQPVTEVNFNDHVGATVEALNVLGIIEDRDRVTDTVTKDFESLGASGRTGEAFIQIPRSLVTLEQLIDASDSATYSNSRTYPKSDVWKKLWIPGNDPNGYSADELDRLTLDGSGNFDIHARLAIFGEEATKEPLLHFLNMPYDDYARDKWGGDQTQLEFIDKAIADYEAEAHEGFEMTPLNAKAVAMIALVRRIKGQTMPMAWGYMRVAALTRKTVDGVSCVGYVYSRRDHLRLRGSRGASSSSIGVGLSVGPKDIEA